MDTVGRATSPENPGYYATPSVGWDGARNKMLHLSHGSLNPIRDPVYPNQSLLISRRRKPLLRVVYSYPAITILVGEGPKKLGNKS